MALQDAGLAQQALQPVVHAIGLGPRAPAGPSHRAPSNLGGSRRKLLAWRHSGFSAHVGEAIPFDDKKAIEDVACYMVRAPLSLKKLVYLDSQKAVLYRSSAQHLAREIPFSVWMNPNFTGSPSRRRPRPFLVSPAPSAAAEPHVAAPPAPPARRRQCSRPASANIHPRLLHPMPNRRRRQIQIARDLPDRLASVPDQANHLRLVLRCELLSCPPNRGRFTTFRCRAASTRYC